MTWSDVIGSTLAFVDDPDLKIISTLPSLVRETPGRQTFDGWNDVAWMDLKGKNTLAVTWSGTSGGVPEADVAMNTDFDWVNDFDAQTVFLHEGGHVIGIGHSEVDEAVMAPTYHGVDTDLDSDDVAAVLALYGEPNDAPVVEITSPTVTVFDSGADINFAGSATDMQDGDLTASLTWTSSIDDSIGTSGSFTTSLSDGVHIITASVVDSGSVSGNDSISITVGDVAPPPPPPGAVTVETITYAWSGGRDSNKHLEATVTMVDADTLAPVEGVTVFATLVRIEDGSSWDFAGATAADGTVVFKLIGAGNTDSCYNLTVTSISGAEWDGGQLVKDVDECRP